MKKLDLNEVKKIELEMLDAFNVFCKKHELMYFLIGGSLIGAVRHRGMIPWDDDIDVAMPRADYEKMESLLINDGLSDEIKLCSLKNDRSVYPFDKLININTKVSEKYLNEQGSSHVWIDIFPIDCVPNSQKQCKKMCKKLNRYRLLLGLTHSNPDEGKNVFKRIGKRFLFPIMNKIGSKKIAKKIDKIAVDFSVKESDYMLDLVWGYGIKERMKKDVFAGTIDLEFEGKMYPVPKGYKTFLNSVYGNYMKLPPENQRITHSFEAYWINELKDV